MTTRRALRKRWFLLFGNEACRTKVCRDGKPPTELPPAGTPVLYIGDFGMLENRSDRGRAAWDRETARSWIEYGLALRQRGCSACALVPCPRQRWDQTIATVWTCAYWSESATAPPMERGWTPLERVPEADSRALQQMAALAAPALRIERSLLRELRRLLPHQWNHPGAEYDFFHDCSRNLDAVYVPRDKFAAAIARFRGLPPDTKQQIVDLLRAHHADCAEIVRARETLLLNEGQAPVSQEEVKRAVQLIRSACALLLRYVRANDPESIRRRGFTNWQEAELESFTDSTAEEIAVAWKLARKASGEQVAERPDAIADQDLLWLETVLNQPPATPIPWEMHRAGDDLRFDVAQAEPAEHVSKSTPPTLCSHPGVRSRFGSCLDESRRNRQGRSSVGTKPTAARYRRGPEARSIGRIGPFLTCEAWTPPRWATRFGWDRRGMVADFAVKGVRLRCAGFRRGNSSWVRPRMNRDGSREGPQHRVTIGRGFWLGETPVTQGQYAAVTGQRPSYFEHAGDRAPVEQVDWDECQAFCEKLAGLVPDFDSSLSFRLPSEAEWEYACRGGTTGALYTGPLTILGRQQRP
jgi:hypothetical protein